MTCCTVANCDRPRRGRTPLCDMHRIRLATTGSLEEGPNTRSRRRNENFWREMLDAGNSDGPCVEWPGAKNRNGYGVFRRNGQNLATRSLWVEANGPIPDGMLVCHRCDNPPCVRLSHLFLGTPADNSADMASKGRSPRNAGERSGRCKFTDAQIAAVRGSRAAGLTLEEIAAEFGISASYASRLTTGQRRTTHPKDAEAEGWALSRRKGDVA